jgi:hypothetical protein
LFPLPSDNVNGLNGLTMASNDLLCVPLKRASDIDVSKPLRNLIQSVYSTSDAPVNMKERLAEMQKLRQTAIKATGSGEGMANVTAK